MLVELAAASALATAAGSAPLVPVPLRGMTPARISCGGGDTAFRPRALRSRVGVEADDTPGAAALRRYVRTFPEPYLAPPRDWRRLFEHRLRALFANGPLDHLVTAEFAVVDGRWRWRRSGQCPKLRAVVRGLDASPWRLASRGGPGSRVLVLRVQEEACASGHAAYGRVEPPLMYEDDPRVGLRFRVRPRPGRLQTCPSNPPTTVRVRLPRPVGDRALVDTGVYPPVTR